MPLTPRRNHLLLTVICCCLVPAATAIAPPLMSSAAPADHVEFDGLAQQANELLGLYASEIATLEVPTTPGEPFSVVLPISGEEFVLDLSPYSVRSSDYRVLAQVEDGSYVEMQPQTERTLRGVIRDMPGSIVAASLLDDGLYARIILDEENDYWIEPIAGRIAGAAPGQYVIYHGDDVIPNGNTCAADAISQPVDDGDGGYGTREACGTGGVLCLAELACDADYEYYQHWGSVSAVENRINTVINTVNVQYERDVSITHYIVTIIVRTSSGANPYTTNDPETLLNQFRNEWRANHTDIHRDMAQLFTGRNLSGNVIGIAWVSAVCGQYAYAVVQSDCCGSLSCSADLSAHEMGHNWGADHCSCPTYTMNAGLTCSNRFQPVDTVPDIDGFRNSRQFCLDAGTNCNVVFTTQPDPTQTVCAGGFVQLSVAVEDSYLMTYQWRKGTTNLVDDGTHILGSTGDTLTIVNFSAADEAADYNCVVTNTVESCSETSDDAELLIDNTTPVITGQPADATITEGDFVIFTVTVEDPLFAAYQWRHDGVNLSNGGRISGADGDTLTIVLAELADAGQYDCVVASTIGGQCSATSDAATLTVNAGGNDCPEDLNGDGSVGLDDLSTLLANYGMTGANPEDGDFDGDGDVDLNDLSQLLAVYGQDCPTH